LIQIWSQEESFSTAREEENKFRHNPPQNLVRNRMKCRRKKELEVSRLKKSHLTSPKSHPTKKEIAPRRLKIPDLPEFL